MGESLLLIAWAVLMMLLFCVCAELQSSDSDLAQLLAVWWYNNCKTGFESQKFHRTLPYFGLRHKTRPFLEISCHQRVWFGFDWCCFHYFVRNSLVALLEALCARICSLDSRISVYVWLFFFCCCCCKVSNKAFLPPLLPRLLCLVVSIPLVRWLYMCACVCVPLYVHVKMSR